MADTMDQTIGDTVSEASRQGLKGAKPTKEASGPLQDKVKEVVEAASHLTDKARNKAEEWTAYAGDVASGAKDQSQEFAAAVAEKAVGLSRELSGFVRRHPVPTLLVGVGVGFLIMQALRRSRSN
jgi:ElaB/YqjD/DUF883 family membrane-anchored ribosome-binding protein